MKRLDLVAGPNGAGKSTLVRLAIAPQLPGSVFVNADLIAAERWPGDAEQRSYEAAQIASKTRDALITQGRSFIAETVFSHPSKLNLITHAQAERFTVVLHVVLVTPDLSVARVAHRVAAGGHNVPEDKIRERHARLGALLAAAIGRADDAYVYDNTGLEGPRLVATFSGGTRVGAAAWPSWAAPELAEL